MVDRGGTRRGRGQQAVCVVGSGKHPFYRWFRSGVRGAAGRPPPPPPPHSKQKKKKKEKKSNALNGRIRLSVRYKTAKWRCVLGVWRGSACGGKGAHAAAAAAAAAADGGGWRRPMHDSALIRRATQACWPRLSPCSAVRHHGPSGECCRCLVPVPVA